MSAAPAHARQGLIAAWVAQLIGTIVLASVVMVYVRTAGAPFATGEQRRDVAVLATFTLFDADHFGAEVTEQRRAVWPRDVAPEVENADATEHAHRAFTVNAAGRSACLPSRLRC